MDAQDHRYIGIGIVFEALVTSIGSYRALASQQVEQLQALDAKVKALESKVAEFEKPTPPA